MNYKIEISQVYKATVYINGKYYRCEYAESEQLAKRLALDDLIYRMTLEKISETIQNGGDIPQINIIPC